MPPYLAKDISLTARVLLDKYERTQVWKFPLPILRPLSVIGLAVGGLPGDGVQLAPGLPSGLIDLALFLLGKLLIGNEFLHTDSSSCSF